MGTEEGVKREQERGGNERRDRAGKGAGRREAPRGFAASFSTADSARPPTPRRPRDPRKPLGASPVVDLQDGEPRVLRQLLLLLLRRVRVLWPPARVTLPARLPSGPRGLAPWGWRAQAGAGPGNQLLCAVPCSPRAQWREAEPSFRQLCLRAPPASSSN